MEETGTPYTTTSEEWIGIGQAALFLGVSPARARRLADSGSLGEVRVEAHSRWRTVSRKGVGDYMLNRPGPGRPRRQRPDQKAS
jgi:hypothetical protein